MIGNSRSKGVGHDVLFKPVGLMAHPDCEGAKVCSAPWHRRLRERADADCTADTPSTVLPRSRRDSAGAADRVGSLSSDQTEVLHHCGRSAVTVAGECG